LPLFIVPVTSHTPRFAPENEGESINAPIDMLTYFYLSHKSLDLITDNKKKT